MQRQQRWLRALFFTVASSYSALGMGQDLPREAASLKPGQVERGIDARLEEMRQRHESNRAVRQAAKVATLRERSRVDAEPVLSRDPVELSVQALPATNE